MEGRPLARIPSDEFVVMENDPDTEHLIKRSLRKLGYRVRVVKSAEEAVRSARRRRTRSFILDIHMGTGREQEGLTALEQIKSLDKDIFVGVLSGYPNRYRQMAYRLNANVFQAKSDNQKDDVYVIVRNVLAHMQALNSANIRKMNHLLGAITEQDPTVEDLPPTDINYVAYQKLRSDPRWLKEHLGNYIAFVDGRIVGEDTDKLRLLMKLQRDYPKQPVFFTKVEEHELVVDIPAPLSIDDL